MRDQAGAERQVGGRLAEGVRRAAARSCSAEWRRRHAGVHAAEPATLLGAVASCRASSSARCTACWAWASSLTWGLLRQINLAHFAFAFLGGVPSYQLATRAASIRSLTLASSCRCSSRSARRCTGCWRASRSRRSTRCCVTFGLTGIIEALIQCDLDRRLPQARVGTTASMKFKVGALYVPVPELITLRARGGAVARACGRCCATPTSARRCARSAEDAPIAAAFGVNQRRNGAAARRHLRGARRRRRRVPRAHATRSRRRRSTPGSASCSPR